MKQELDRVKNDVETIQRALGLSPSLGQDSIQWMKRDNWLNLWWCLPGFILIASALLPLGNTEKYFGLVLAQWTGLLVASVMLGITIFSIRRVTANDGRPESLIREYRRIHGLNAQGMGFSLVLLVEFFLYLIWGRRYGLNFEAFWSGLWIVMGSSCLVAAVASNAWPLLGWAIPFLAYGLFQTVLPSHGKLNGIPLGMMFIAIALSFSIIQVWQIRKIAAQHEPH